MVPIKTSTSRQKMDRGRVLKQVNNSHISEESGDRKPLFSGWRKRAHFRCYPTNLCHKPLLDEITQNGEQCLRDMLEKLLGKLSLQSSTDFFQSLKTQFLTKLHPFGFCPHFLCFEQSWTPWKLLQLDWTRLCFIITKRPSLSGWSRCNLFFRICLTTTRVSLH